MACNTQIRGEQKWGITNPTDKLRDWIDPPPSCYPLTRVYMPLKKRQKIESMICLLSRSSSLTSINEFRFKEEKEKGKLYIFIILCSGNFFFLRYEFYIFSCIIEQIVDEKKCDILIKKNLRIIWKF